MTLKLPALFKNRIFLHVLFWAAHVLFYATLYGSFEEKYTQAFVEELIFLPVKILFTYFVLYYLLPRYILRGQYGIFTIVFLLSSFIAGLCQRYIAFQIDYPLYYPQYLTDPFFFFAKIIKAFV